MRRDRLIRAASVALLAGWMAACPGVEPVHAQDLAVSAKVDKTTIEFGSPVQLLITVSGDPTGVTLEPVTFPEKFVVASRSQATNFSIQGGVQERSMSLVYILIPREAGTFQLGPFSFTKGKQKFETAPIEITVTKPALPPKFRAPAERFTL